METGSTASSEQTGGRGLELVAFCLVILALGLAYAPNFSYLLQIWDSNPNYSYGYLVIPATLLILWLRRGLLDPTRMIPWRLGWVLLVGIFVLRTLLYERNEKWLEDATIPFAAAFLALSFGGWHLLRWSLPAIFFLGFMLPLPYRVNVFLSGPLQQLATFGSRDLLELLGLPVVAEGNVINIGSRHLEVARACNGLSMLLSFITLLTAAAILVDRPLLDRLILLASAIPIALIVNILRISITGICVHMLGSDEVLLGFGLRLPHDWSGYLMMPMALIAVWLELELLSWLMVTEEREPEESLSAFEKMAPPAPRPVRQGKAENPAGAA